MRTSPTIATRRVIERLETERVGRDAPPDALDSAPSWPEPAERWSSSWRVPSERSPSSWLAPAWPWPSSSRAPASRRPSSWRVPSSSPPSWRVPASAVAFLLAGARLAVAFFLAGASLGRGLLLRSGLPRCCHAWCLLGGGCLLGSRTLGSSRSPSPGIARSMLLRGESNDSTTKDACRPPRQLLGALRGRIGHEAQWHVALRAVDGDVCAVRREAIDGALDLGAHAGWWLTKARKASGSLTGSGGASAAAAGAATAAGATAAPPPLVACRSPTRPWSGGRGDPPSPPRRPRRRGSARRCGAPAAPLRRRLLRGRLLRRRLLRRPWSPSQRVAAATRRLATPRTGERSTNTQPTSGTGLPPISRPSSKSHVYSPVELLERVVGEDGRVGLARDRSDERVAATDRTGRRATRAHPRAPPLRRLRRSDCRRCDGRRLRRRPQ